MIGEIYLKQKGFSTVIFCLAVTLIITISSLVGIKSVGATELENINGLNLTEQDIDHLLSLGFSEEEIEYMDNEEYKLNKDLEGKVVSSTTQYLKITEQITGSVQTELSSQKKQSPKPTIKKLDEQTYYEELAKENESNEEFSTLKSKSKRTSYKKMTTSITKLATNKYRLKNSITWSKIPYTRHVDVSGVGINQTYWAPTPDSQYGKQNWKTWSTCNRTKYGSATYTKNSTKWKQGAGGYGLRINLPDDKTNGCASDRVEGLSSYMYYSVKPLTRTNRLDAYGQYAHQQTKSTLTPSISLSGVSFSVSPTNEFAEHPNTHVLVYK